MGWRIPVIVIEEEQSFPLSSNASAMQHDQESTSRVCLGDVTIDTLRSEWVSTVPVTAVSGEYDAIDPVALRTANGLLLVAASCRTSRSVVLSQSNDDGASWRVLGGIAHAAQGNRITVGAAGSLDCGRLVLAIHEWQDMLPWTYTGCSPLYHYRLDKAPYPVPRQQLRREISGQVEWVAEEPRGVHHYAWRGFSCRSTLKVLVSDDDGQTWTDTLCDTAGAPIAPFAMGRVFLANGALWFGVYGPADQAEMGAALGSVGLMRSDDSGKSWQFSHWLARADMKHNIGYGPGEIAVLPDGRWLGMLQGNYRGLGDYARPRICRTVSTDDGRTWPTPAAILLGPKPSLALLDGDRLIVGTRQDRGVIFNMMLNGGEDLHYQDHVWECIGYQAGDRGGLHLLKLDDDTILATYHWMHVDDVRRCKIHSQILRRLDKFRPTPAAPVAAPARDHRWRMAEALQVPDIPDVPGGIRIGTMLPLDSGDWMAIGYGQTFTGEGSYGFTGKGFVVVRAPDIEGPWTKVGQVDRGEHEAASDPGTGSDTPGTMMQTKTGRLLLPVPCSHWRSLDRDMELFYSDDEGLSWASLGLISSQIGLRGLRCGSRIEQLEDGRLIWTLHVGRDEWAAEKGDLCYTVSTDDGQTWSKPHFWAKSQESHYPELLHAGSGVRSECALIRTGPGRWLGTYREERGTVAPFDKYFGPSGMPHICFTHSEDDGRTWTPAFGFLGVEVDMVSLGDGVILCAYREDTLAGAWLSYDEGRTWQLQVDPAELPWARDAADPVWQWPPGGESVIRVLDHDTAVVITDTGLMPACKPTPPEHVVTRELHGRVQVRFFRRVSG